MTVEAQAAPEAPAIAEAQAAQEVPVMTEVQAAQAVQTIAEVLVVQVIQVVIQVVIHLQDHLLTIHQKIRRLQHILLLLIRTAEPLIQAM